MWKVSIGTDVREDMFTQGFYIELRFRDMVFIHRVGVRIVGCVYGINEVEISLTEEFKSEHCRFVVRFGNIVAFMWLNGFDLFHADNS